MTPDRWQEVERLFHAALERPAKQRAAFLESTCSGDVALREEVETLLLIDAQEDDAVEALPSIVAAGWAAQKQSRGLTGQVIGRYKILGALGAGGMGEVYLAEDATLSRKVALKLLPSQFTQDPDRLRRFAQEARTASALNHPNIITIYEIGEWGNSPFIATEYIEGETLREQMRKTAIALA